MLNIDKVAGGQRNVTLHITGVIEDELRLTPIDLVDKELKIKSLVWMVQEKLGLQLWWDEERMMLPMESRNAVRFDTGLKPPAGWNGKLYVSSFNFKLPPVHKTKSFFIVMDLDR